MKKLLVIFLYIVLSIDNVLAEDITGIADIKYKWYKQEETDGIYYSKKDKLDGYLEDVQNIQYDDYTEWKPEYCNYSKDDYLIEEKEITTYDKIVKTKYIRIDINIGSACANDNTCFSEILVFSGKNKVDYNIIKNEQNTKVLELFYAIDINDLWFYINANTRYSIYATDNINAFFFNLGYGLNEHWRVIIPFENWILKNARYNNETTEEEIMITPFVKNIETKKVCRIREKKTYRYKITKQYYDDEYHTNIDGYLPDINDYVINYDRNLEKTEYVYINEDIKQEDKEETNEATDIKPGVVYRTKYIDKITKKGYIVLLILMMVIIVESWIIVKNVD